MISITDKQLNICSRDILIAENPKELPYITFSVNNSLFDRTHPSGFKDEYGVKYNSLAHYIAYQKAVALKLSGEACAEMRSFYNNKYPITRETDSLPYEERFNEHFFDEVQRVPGELRVGWKRDCVRYAVQGIMMLAEQNSEFRISLLGTGEDVLVEDSSSLLWGIGVSDDKDIPFPKRWAGDNGYGQALMAARELLKPSIKKKIFQLLNKKMF